MTSVPVAFRSSEGKYRFAGSTKLEFYDDYAIICGPTQCVNTVPSLTNATCSEVTMANKPSITTERLREVLGYNPETGAFVWLVSPRRNVAAGQVAGTDENGYVRICIARKCYKAHRLAWLYFYGEWPCGEVDHINGVRNDNRISNLRLATHSQNRANVAKYSNNTSGYKGVHWHKQNRKWQAVVNVNGKRISCGLFASREEAHAAYCKKAAEVFGEFHRPD